MAPATPSDQDSDPFRSLAYRLKPDYSDSPSEIPENTTARIRELLVSIYGPAHAHAVSREIIRVMRVHLAYAPPELREAERRFDPAERFTERDVVLITYGDLIVSPGRTPLRTLADFAQVFFQGLITTLHVLPFYPYSSDRGFSVISYDDVDPRLGSWEELEELSGGFRLMFDAVFNHVSADSYWFQQFLDGNADYQDWFIAFSSRTEVAADQLNQVLRPRTSDLLSPYDTINGKKYVWTTFSADQVDLNFRSPAVLLRVLEILLLYIRRGADLLRLDAVTFLWYELGTSCAHLTQTHAIIKLMREILDVVAPHVALVTETNVPHDDNITYFGDGSDQAQMVYNFALPPLVLQAFQVGNAEILCRWAASLDPPSATTCFFNFLDSHDGIGLMGARGILSDAQVDEMCQRVRARGGLVSMRTDETGAQSPYELNTTWFSALNCEGCEELPNTQVDRFMASRAIQLLLRGVPGIYLPSLFASTNDLDAAVRDQTYRSINRAEIEEAELFKAFSNPAAFQTQVAKRFIAMLEQRTRQPALHPNAAQRMIHLDSRVFAIAREPCGAADPVLGLVNVSADHLALSIGSIIRELGASVLVDLFSERKVDGHAPCTLEPYEVLWLIPLRDSSS